MSVDYRARYEALIKLLTDERGAEYADKVIHPYNGPSFQNWRVVVRFPDPLPENYTRQDLDRTRLTLAEAVERYVDLLVKGED